MNTKHIQYILTIVREGSITAASKQLQISQPSLSQTIKIIERDLGTGIFNRNTDPISLTHAGRIFVEAAQRIADIERNLQEAIHIAKNEVHGTIHIGIADQYAPYLLSQAIPEFRSIYPFIQLKLHEHDSEQITRMTLDGLCDLSFVAAQKASEELQYSLVSSDEILLVCSRQAGLAHRFLPESPVSIHEAQDEHFVRLITGHSLRSIEEHILEKHLFSPHTLIETSTLEAAMQFTASCGAVMLLPRSMIIQNPSIHDRIQWHPIRGGADSFNLYVCCRRNLSPTRYMNDFIHIVKSKLLAYSPTDKMA